MEGFFEKRKKGDIKRVPKNYVPQPEESKNFLLNRLTQLIKRENLTKNGKPLDRGDEDRGSSLFCQRFLSKILDSYDN